jgi:hypothetical protein
MLDVRALALATGDTAAFAMPPNRPKRSERRTRGNRGGAGNLVGAIRRQISRAMSEAEDAWRPSLTKYPY